MLRVGLFVFVPKPRLGVGRLDFCGSMCVRNLCGVVQVLAMQFKVAVDVVCQM
jgi:hypothetical protein